VGVGRDLAAVAAGAALLYTLALGARDLWHPNEPTYAEAVAEMAQRGEWLIPTVNGTPFAEKPILYYWLALAACRALGRVDELGLRLPSAAAGVAAVILLYLLVHAHAGRHRARAAAVLFGTTYIVFWSARSIQMDLLLATCTLGAVFSAVSTLDGALAPGRGWAAAGAAAGLGCLAKGPVGLLCPLLVVVLDAAIAGRLRRLARWQLVWGGVAFAAVVAPWYGALLVRGETGFLTELLFRQNVRRFFEPWDHTAPWWYFAEAFALDMLPWAPFVPLAWGLAPRDDGERRLNRLAWVWLVGIVVFFSLSASKRSPYILPAAPAAAILASAVYERWADGRLDRRRRALALALVLALGLVLLVGAAVAAAMLDRRLSSPPELRRAGVIGATLLAAGGLAIVAGASIPWRRRLAAGLALLGFTLASYVVAAALVLPPLDAIKSHRPFCEAIRREVPAAAPLHGYRLWRWRAAYSFYSGRRVRSLESAAELTRYWSRPERVFLVVERGMLDEVRASVDPGRPLAVHAAGHNQAYLFANR